MSKRSYISRYLHIIKRLHATPYTSFKELEGYMERQFQMLRLRDDTLEFAFSKRTWDRDKKEIKDLFNLQIEYSKTHKGYFIQNTALADTYFQQMIEAVDIFNSLNLVQEVAPFIHLEKRKPQGSEHLFGLLHAIANQFQITFSHQKFWDGETTQRLVEPYLLKEFKNRWYLLAKDHKDLRVKSFALDRMSQLTVTNLPFEHPVSPRLEENYRDCFGIIGPEEGEKPEDIILSFDPFQGKYIKTLPLHHSQQILIDDDDELQVQLKLYITHDFVMELLSMGENVKVLQPNNLIADVKKALEKAFFQYNNKEGGYDIFGQ